MFYQCNEMGVLEPCDEQDMPRLGGKRYLSSKQVKEHSGGLYDQAGWIAAYVQAPLAYGGDDLGTQGIFSHADGKMYDSKSAYYRSVKEAGLEIVGNEKIKPSQPVTKPINWERAVAETLKQTPLKGLK